MARPTQVVSIEVKSLGGQGPAGPGSVNQSEGSWSVVFGSNHLCAAPVGDPNACNTVSGTNSEAKRLGILKHLCVAWIRNPNACAYICTSV